MTSSIIPDSGDTKSSAEKYGKAQGEEEEEDRCIGESVTMAGVVGGSSSRSTYRRGPYCSAVTSLPELGERLPFRGDYREWMVEDDATVEYLEREMIGRVVDGVDEPSLYLLAATRGTFGAPELSPRRDSVSAVTKRLGRYNVTAITVSVLFALLTMLTTVVPLCMLANFYQRLEWANFDVDVDVGNRRTRARHKLYLRVTSAALLMYLIYTSLSVLDELNVFRFFLLAMRPRRHHDEEAPPPPPPPVEDLELTTLSASSSSTGDIGASSGPPGLQKRPSLLRIPSARNVMEFAGDLLAPSRLSVPILYLGVVSKSLSLVAIYQLTYLVFRTGFQPMNMVLEGVALTFLLDVDRNLVNALRNTVSLRRFYARAVHELRDEAEIAVSTPGLVRSIVEPKKLGFRSLLKHALTVDLELAASSSSSNQQQHQQQQQQRGDCFNYQAQLRRCCRSELARRLISRFIYGWATVLIAMQVIGNIICSYRIGDRKMPVCKLHTYIRIFRGAD